MGAWSLKELETLLALLGDALLGQPCADETFNADDLGHLAFWVQGSTRGSKNPTVLGVLKLRGHKSTRPTIFVGFGDTGSDPERDLGVYS